MPWHTSDLLQAREEFIKLADSGDQYFSRLCSSFGISRVTGYRWLRRYRLADKATVALKDRSRGPHNSPNRVTQDAIELVLNQRAQSGWGARKLSVTLGQAGVRISPSTVNKILKEHGRIAAEDPNTASWIKQVFVADDPLSKSQRMFRPPAHPLPLRNAYDTAVCVIERRQWQSSRDSRGYDSTQSPRVLT